MIQAAAEAENNPEIKKPDSTETSDHIQKEYDGNEYLNRFYEALLSLENDPGRKVRIAYYGDSMTDGDLITQDLREHFQDRFGGGGVGFVPITSESAKSRASIVHQFSSDWKKYHLLPISDQKQFRSERKCIFYHRQRWFGMAQNQTDCL